MDCTSYSKKDTYNSVASPVPEEHEESVALDEHPDERVSEEDDEDAPEEGRRSLDLVPLEEEPERPLQPDHEG